MTDKKDKQIQLRSVGIKEGLLYAILATVASLGGAVTMIAVLKALEKYVQ